MPPNTPAAANIGHTSQGVPWLSKPRNATGPQTALMAKEPNAANVLPSFGLTAANRYASAQANPAVQANHGGVECSVRPTTHKVPSAMPSTVETILTMLASFHNR